MFWRMAGLSTASAVSSRDLIYSKRCYLCCLLGSFFCLLDPILLAFCYLEVGYRCAFIVLLLRFVGSRRGSLIGGESNFGVLHDFISIWLVCRGGVLLIGGDPIRQT